MTDYRRMTERDWLAILAAGYHCEYGRVVCTYRPAPEWYDGRPICAACKVHVLDGDKDPE